MPIPKMERRAYQLECLRALRRAFNDGQDKGLFVLATGLGKTYTAIRFVAWALGQARLKRLRRRPRVLVLCHQNGILTQLRDEFRKHLGGGFSYGVLNGVEKRPDGDVDFLFATFQTMSSARESFGSDYFDLLLVDEGHHSAAETYAETILYFQVAFRLAMTATPNRMDMKDIRVLFGGELYSKRLVEALAERLVPRVRYKVFLERRRRLADLPRRQKKISRRTLQREYFHTNPSPSRDEEVADIIARYYRELGSPRLLVFCQDIAHCERFVRLLAARGITAAAVHSDADHKENEDRIERFKNGRLPAIVARDILNEGKDLPAVSLIAAVRTTGSLTIFEQQLGRGLRPGKEELTFLDFVANCERMTLISRVVNDIALMHRDWLESRPRTGDVDAHGAEDRGNDETPITVESGEVSFIEELRELTAILGASIESWTRESALTGLRALARRLGQDFLSSQDVHQGSREGICPGVNWLAREFKTERRSIIPALEAAGLGTKGKKWMGWTRDEAREALRALAESLGRSELTARDLEEASKEGLCPHPGWLRREFDPEGSSLASALEAVGLRAKIKKRFKWTRDSALAAIRSLAERLGRSDLSMDDLTEAAKEGRCPGTSWLIRAFDPERRSLIPALEAAGVSPKGKPRIRWTQDEAIQSLRALAERLGRSDLSGEDIRRASKEGSCPGNHWLSQTFDPAKKSIVPALEAAGLAAKARRPEWTRESAIAALRSLATELGRSEISSRQLEAASKRGVTPSTYWLIQEFSSNQRSLDPALKAAGLKLRGKEWTRESALAGLRALAERLGRTEISHDDLLFGSKEGISPSMYWLRQHFDPEGRSYLPALEAAGLSSISRRADPEQG